MELKEQTKDITSPEEAFHAWNHTRASKDVDEQLKALLMDRILSYQWTARAFYNVIEDHYPALSTDPDQVATRRRLMLLLQAVMQGIEHQREKDKKHPLSHIVSL